MSKFLLEQDKMDYTTNENNNQSLVVLPTQIQYGQYNIDNKMRFNIDNFLKNSLEQFQLKNKNCKFGPLERERHEDIKVFDMGNSKCLFKGAEEICRGLAISEKGHQFLATKINQQNLIQFFGLSDQDLQQKLNAAHIQAMDYANNVAVEVYQDLFKKIQKCYSDLDYTYSMQIHKDNKLLNEIDDIWKYINSNLFDSLNKMEENLTEKVTEKVTKKLMEEFKLKFYDNRQIDKELNTIKSKINSLEESNNNELDKLNNSLNNEIKKVNENITKKVKNIENSLEDVVKDTEFREILENLEKKESINNVNKRFEEFKSNLGNIKTENKNFENKFSNSITNFEKKINKINSEINNIKNNFEDLKNISNITTESNINEEELNKFQNNIKILKNELERKINNSILKFYSKNDIDKIKLELINNINNVKDNFSKSTNTLTRSLEDNFSKKILECNNNLSNARELIDRNYDDLKKSINEMKDDNKIALNSINTRLTTIFNDFLTKNDGFSKVEVNNIIKKEIKESKDELNNNINNNFVSKEDIIQFCKKDEVKDEVNSLVLVNIENSLKNVLTKIDNNYLKIDQVSNYCKKEEVKNEVNNLKTLLNNNYLNKNEVSNYCKKDEVKKEVNGLKELLNKNNNNIDNNIKSKMNNILTDNKLNELISKQIIENKFEDNILNNIKQNIKEIDNLKNQIKEINNNNIINTNNNILNNNNNSTLTNKINNIINNNHLNICSICLGKHNKNNCLYKGLNKCLKCGFNHTGCVCFKKFNTLEFKHKYLNRFYSIKKIIIKGERLIIKNFKVYNNIYKNLEYYKKKAILNILNNYSKIDKKKNYNDFSELDKNKMDFQE